MTQNTKIELATDRLTKRLELAKTRAAARAERAADAATDAGSGAISLVKKHPFATIGGAIVVGAVVAQLLPGKIGKGSRKSSRRAFDLAAAAAEIAFAYAKRASENAADTRNRMSAGFWAATDAAMTDTISSSILEIVTRRAVDAFGSSIL